MSLLFRASARHLLRHRAQCLLAVSGIALGVAIVIGIQITQQSARSAFDRSLDSVFGPATHQITALDGFLEESHLRVVRTAAPHWNPTPILEGVVKTRTHETPVFLRVAGIDPLSISGNRGTPSFDVRRLLRAPGAAIINRATAERLAVQSGQSLKLADGHGPGLIEILDVVDSAAEGGHRLADDVVIVDIATAQELLNLPGRISRIELNDAVVGGDVATLKRLRAALPPTVAITERGRNIASARQITQAFYTNLDALSLLALLVGAFMIYNTMAFLVAQRQTLFARLRALGVTRKAIALQISGEALWLGLIGGCVGNLLGYVIATILMQPMSQTLNDHYFSTTLSRVEFSPTLFVVGLGLAVITTLAAAAIPVAQAAAVAPAQIARASVQEAYAQRLLISCERGGALFGIVGLSLLALTSHSLYAGFAALGCLLLAATLAAPRSVQRLLNVLKRYGADHLPLAERLALKGASRSMGRIGIAVAALMAATATSIGVGLMVDSFRSSVTDWLEQLLRADFYISQDFEHSPEPLIEPQFAARLLEDPRIAALSKVRRSKVMTADGEIRVTAYDLPEPARAGFRFIAGNADLIWRQWETSDSLFVSEPFAWRHRVNVGDIYRLPTPAGPRDMTIAAIYADYGSEQGVIAISWYNYLRYWRDPRAHGLGVYPLAGTNQRALKTDLAEIVASIEYLSLWSNGEIKQRSLAVFDRTFAITDVLAMFAALIAALGVFNALLALNLERRREYAIMRAIGCKRALVRRTLYAQSAVVASLAVALAVPLGVLIAVMLIEIINVRSFGWSMAFSWHLPAILLPCVLALGAAILATIYPAEQALQSDPALALRYE